MIGRPASPSGSTEVAPSLADCSHSGAPSECQETDTSTECSRVRDADGRLWAADGTQLCGKDGCTKVAWHSGLCIAVLSSRRGKKPVRAYEAEPAPSSRELIKRAREDGRLPPLKKRADVEQQEQKLSKRKTRPADNDERVGMAEQGPRKGLRRGTRSHGAPVWNEANLASDIQPVIATLSLIDGRVTLQLGVQPRAALADKAPKELRDFLGKGTNDKAANESISSHAWLIATSRTVERGVRWGCLCKGAVLHGGTELKCRRYATDKT